MARNKYGKWTIVDNIGEGGQTSVHLVRNSEAGDDKLYVIKLLKNLERKARFVTEVTERAELSHPGIPELLDHDLKAERPYLVETYVKGGDLTKNRTIFDRDIIKTLRYFSQVCEAVAYAHSKNVKHRDIKPANILYERNSDSMLVTDFGICFGNSVNPDERITSHDEQVGSRDYIAPELQSGRVDYVRPESDIYSLGKLLYWMFTGKVLYREEHRNERWDLVQLGFDLQVERVNRLLDRMVQEEPSDRYSSMGHVVSAVKQVINLIERDYNVVRVNFYQHCIYCGKGAYDTVAVYYPEKHKTKGSSDPYYLSARSDFRKYGVELPVDTEQIWIILLCKYCGNTQVFIRPDDVRSWEDPMFQLKR